MKGASVDLQQPHSQQKKVIATLAVLVVTVVIVLGVKGLSNRSSAVASNLNSGGDSQAASGADSSSAASNAGAATSSSDSSSSATSANTSYKDGSYTATGSYDSPGGTESITVSVTLQSDVITASSAQPGARDDEAKEFQDEFIANYKPLVVGKDITSVRLSNVAGSSLTSQGFNAALSRIKSQAKA